MSGKDMAIEFANAVFALLLIGVVILYFVVGDNMGTAKKIIQIAMPFALFAAPFVIRMRMLKNKERKENEDNDGEIILYLEYFDKMKAEMMAFGVGITVYVVGLLNSTDNLQSDLMQGLIAFIIVFVWQKSLFNKR